MLNPFKMFNRLAWLAMLLFGGGTAVMVSVVVLATGGLGSSGLVETPRDTAAPGGPEVTLNDVVEKRPVFQDVPLPGEISTEPSVIGTNLTLAVLLAIIFGIDSTILNNLLRQEEDRIRRRFDIPPFSTFFRLMGWGAGQNVRRGCLTLPIIVSIFALYGLIFAFLEDGLNIFSPEGIQLAIVMAMSVGLISLAGDVAQRQVARFWRRSARFGIYPANTLLAVLTTAFSRISGISPGIVFGVPGGADIDTEGEPPLHDVILAFTTLTVVIVLGGLGWAAAAAIRAVGDQTMTASQADFAGPLAQLGLSIGLAIFLVAIETAFFEMVPITATFGTEIFRWNVLIWFVSFVPVMFAFTHTLLNPDSDYLQAFEQTNVQVLTVMVGLLTAVTAFAWFYFRVLNPRRAAAPKYASPYGPPPQRPYSQTPPVPAQRQAPPPPPAYPAPRQQVPPPPPPRVEPPRPAQVVPPPPRTVEPPRPSQVTPPPPPLRRDDYVPPPIVISDDVPPPIVIGDQRPEQPPKPPRRPDEDETRTDGDDDTFISR